LAPKVRKWVLPGLALLTFISSWAGAYSPRFIERIYARWLFPAISFTAGRVADSVSFAWLDPAILLLIIFLILVIRWRRWAWLWNGAAVLYLVFFWSWGLNYHRQPLSSKLPIDAGQTQAAALDQFARRVAAEMNRLFAGKQSQRYDEVEMQAEAAERVRRVVAIIDGTDWSAAQRLKKSVFASPWMRAAGIDGVFNPLAHEPIVATTLLDIERPFVAAHELAHVRGYPDEGDANVIAVYATLMSSDIRFQYSGWMNLWLYVRSRDRDQLLEPGPRADVRQVFERARREEIGWINDFQRRLLDLFLKANDVEQGVRSYSRVVIIAAGTQPSWEHFR
jgi:hypothetical protein